MKMVYKIRMTEARAGNGTDMLYYFKDDVSNKKTYPTLDKARSSARRKVNIASGFYMCGVYNDSNLVGYVVCDSDYRYGGYSGIFWVPKGKNHEGYIAQGVNVDGSLNTKAYRLT